MSDYTIHEETYVHKNGKSYLVEVTADHHLGRPDEEYPDCHGVVVELDFDPEDEESVDKYIENNTEEGSIEEIAERARLALMRPLGNSYNRWDKRKYYDVWASIKKAREVWGVKESKVQEVVDEDYKYLNGWYSDDWHWACVAVYALDEDGEKDEDTAHHCGGYESTIIDSDQREWFEEVIEDSIAQVEHEIRKALHKGQLELALCD